MPRQQLKRAVVIGMQVKVPVKENVIYVSFRVLTSVKSLRSHFAPLLTQAGAVLEEWWQIKLLQTYSNKHSDCDRMSTAEMGRQRALLLTTWTLGQLTIFQLHEQLPMFGSRRWRKAVHRLFDVLMIACQYWQNWNIRPLVGSHWFPYFDCMAIIA